MNDACEYHLYILLCDQKTLYTGIALDPQARLAQHQQGAPFGAKFTRRFEQLEIVYQVKVGGRSLAQSLEIKFKQLNRKTKLKIIDQKLNIEQLIGILK